MRISYNLRKQEVLPYSKLAIIMLILLHKKLVLKSRSK